MNNREATESLVISWAKEKGIDSPVRQAFKSISEMGEIADAMCKLKYNGDKLAPNQDLSELIDVIGDTEVTLTILKAQLNLDQDYPLSVAWGVIKNRTGKNVNGTFVKDK